MANYQQFENQPPLPQTGQQMQQPQPQYVNPGYQPPPYPPQQYPPMQSQPQQYPPQQYPPQQYPPQQYPPQQQPMQPTPVGAPPGQSLPPPPNQGHPQQQRQFVEGFNNNAPPQSYVTKCPNNNCKADISTKTELKNGAITWISAGGCCLFGCWLGCCLIPFCIDDLKDVYHYCPRCNHLIGTRKII